MSQVTSVTIGLPFIVSILILLGVGQIGLGVAQVSLSAGMYTHIKHMDDDMHEVIGIIKPLSSVVKNIGADTHHIDQDLHSINGTLNHMDEDLHSISGTLNHMDEDLHSINGTLNNMDHDLHGIHENIKSARVA